MKAVIVVANLHINFMQVTKVVGAMFMLVVELGQTC